MPMYNLIEYSDNYSKISKSLWQYYKDKPALAAVAVANFSGNSASFKFKKQIAGETGADETRNAKIMGLSNI